MTGDISLRTPTNGDMPFIRSVFFETQRWMIETLFGWRGDDVEIATFEESYDVDNTSIIVVDGEDAGWMTVQRDAHIELDSLYLKPAIQGRGLGTLLIRGLISEAETTGRPLRLSTTKINPARRLYERLGFANVDESEFKVFMEWRTPTQGPRFERPAAQFAESFAAMRDAFMGDGDDRWPGPREIAHRDPVSYAAMLKAWSKGTSLPDGFVRSDVFWIVFGNIVVGECNIRHVLTPALEQIGGNIGYHVHPRYRNRGIATFALREALRIAADIGIEEALLTCVPDNGASIRVIEKCGGRRIEETQHQRYLISTRPRTP